MTWKSNNPRGDMSRTYHITLADRPDKQGCLCTDKHVELAYSFRNVRSFQAYCKLPYEDDKWCDKCLEMMALDVLDQLEL